MWIPFQELPDHARLWVYQANRAWSKAEEALMSAELTQFCADWQAHGNALKASFTTRYSQFLILAVDESHAGASGCSIDGSVRKIREIEMNLDISLLDRTAVAFMKGDQIVTLKLQDLKGGFLTGELNGEMTTFNNAVASKREYEQNWKIPVKNSWLAKYLPKTALQR